ncbi:hypothetical protein J7J47_02555 [Halomonas sp. ISL-60]|uniref:DUF6968 family protein n=1 Tax=unclassified Halomonas TaxID=2609666 RepID=UPI0007D9B455|nr:MULTISPECIES: hypothetical protein [unclassified Halomonas]MBT2771112.1 hypothetical protein [Halomonas sp. ISL-60]MBT2785309.1 hypothetical protein [Halomonas sp. ISL-106]MBT2799330.1 hypothetical protein [Halomonas sp. ISL-104]MBT2799812.1 hypothetical protein [Halomonas sp. ISL-56]OAL59588.1 hypothetical protein A6R74_02835 [Halomonas sp. ALS9]
MDPISTSYTETIASRVFDAVFDGSRQQIRLEIGQPIQDVETVGGTDWRCPVRLLINESQVYIQNACGVDSYQALALAINQLSGFALHRAASGCQILEFLGQSIKIESLLQITHQGTAPDVLTGVGVLNDYKNS